MNDNSPDIRAYSTLPWWLCLSRPIHHHHPGSIVNDDYGVGLSWWFFHHKNHQDDDLACLGQQVLWAIPDQERPQLPSFQDWPLFCKFLQFSQSLASFLGICCIALCIRYTPILTHYPHAFGHIIASPCALGTHLSIPLCIWTHHCIPLFVEATSLHISVKWRQSTASANCDLPLFSLVTFAIV